MKTRQNDPQKSVIPIVELITLLSDLVVFKHYDFDEFLKKVIILVAEVVTVDACLIYFYDNEKKQLSLAASKILHSDLVGTITLKKGEGITGWVVEHGTSVAIEKEAYKDPRFKPFKELPEDLYEAFLSVPIIDESGVIGVINLQNKLPYKFLSTQVELLEAIVKIIAAGFAQVVLTRRVGKLQDKLKERQVIEEAKGLLMKLKSIDESEAYHYIRKEAMCKRKSMREIAEAVLLVLK